MRNVRGVSRHLTDITALYLRGQTLAEIGAIYGVSRERIRQVLSSSGVTGKDGGVSETARRRRASLNAKKDKRCLDRWGMTRGQYKKISSSLTADGNTVGRVFSMQKRNAKKRGIEWRLSLRQWWDIWEASGVWHKRGRGAGKFCMSRVADSGAYEAGNVFIQECSSNSREGRRLAHAVDMPKSAVYDVVQAAGGRARVAEATGATPQYISQLANCGYLPASWNGDGRVDALAVLAAGRFSKTQIVGLATGPEPEK